MIGLVDYDLLTTETNSMLIPNVEIMKLATYYRVEEQQFCRLLSLDEVELNQYEKIYFFSEKEARPQVPENYLRANNVIYGGSAFTKDYIPFDNTVIDYTLPKPNIYVDFLREKFKTNVKINTLEHLLDDSYYRNYAGDNRLPIPAIRKNKRIFLFDKQFFYDDWQKTLDEISMRAPSSIVRIHPVICNTLGQYFTLREYQRFARTNTIILDLDIPLEESHYMFKKYKHLFLADITQTSKVCLPLGGSFKTNQIYYKDLIYKLNLLYSFWAQGIPIKIKYIEPDIGFKNPIATLSKTIEICGNISVAAKQDKTINDRIPKKKKQNFIRDERDELLKFFPYAKDLFDQNFNDLRQRGRWNI